MLCTPSCACRPERKSGGGKKVSDDKSRFHFSFFFATESVVSSAYRGGKIDGTIIETVYNGGPEVSPVIIAE